MNYLFNYYGAIFGNNDNMITIHIRFLSLQVISMTIQMKNIYTTIIFIFYRNILEFYNNMLLLSQLHELSTTTEN